MSLYSHMLQQRQEQSNPIRVGVIGTGKFGGGLVVQLAQVPGMVTSVVADLDIDRARRALITSGAAEADVVAPTSVGELADAVRQGRPAAVDDSALLAGCQALDVVVDATGVPDAGARHAVTAIDAGNHVIMVNIEADVTVGAALARRARSAGVVYSLVDGDQPGCIMEIVEWATSLGFEIVAAGRGTVYLDSDREGTPESIQDRFGFDDDTMSRRTINPHMYNSFRDGTKAQLEMTALANMTGLPPDVRGMHEPSANLEDIPRIFSLKEEGGLLSQRGVVELANSVAEDGVTPLDNPLRMGVFVVIRAEHDFIREDLTNYHCYPGGEGNFLLYRPYHLVAVEAPLSIARCVLYNLSTGAPHERPAADLITVAKRDLKAGEILEGGGGHTVNGIIEKAEIAHRERLLPLGLSKGAVLARDVAASEAVARADVESLPDSYVGELREQQDQLVWG
ncbi:MAG: hypothetical protein VX733_01430 [Candidatus Latescibacterota bacterium]|nr:hypothetical protein [Candidatus Latescibacterota bacterium]